MTNLGSISKSRDITLPTKIHIMKVMFFSSSHVWMWKLVLKGAWVPKNSCFWNCGFGEDLRVPRTVRRSNQSILKEINPEYSLEGLMLKLKLQHFGHLIWRANSLGKTLMLGKIEGRRRGWQRMRWSAGITDSMDMSLSKLLKMVKGREDWCAAVLGVTKSQTHWGTEQQQKDKQVLVTVGGLREA